jgi:D-alanine-D-alanine ligase
MDSLPKSLRIGVIRGGPSTEYKESLLTGEYVLSHLRETHKPFDIFISKDGTWHLQGLERTPDRVLKHTDVVWNALHGEYGEDGKIQEILNHHGVPFTGSDRYASAIAMNKVMTKERAHAMGIKTPVFDIVRRGDNLVEKAKALFNSIPHPLMVKPTCGGSSLGVYIARTYKELLGALETILEIHGSAIVEEYIDGKSVSCLVTENLRGQDVYAFPVSFKVGKNDSNEILEISKLVHDELGLRHFSKSDFIVSPRRGIYFLEVNTQPKLGRDSIVHQSLEAVGIKAKDFIDHILGLAIKK